MKTVNPKKKFGQNFLNDNSIATQIVDFLSTEKTKNIIEVGPGMGILTKEILKIDNLNELTNVIPLKLKNEVNINRDSINIIIVKKYLFISSRLKLIFVKINLFIKTFLGLLKDKIWFKENLNNE